MSKINYNIPTSMVGQHRVTSTEEPVRLPSRIARALRMRRPQTRRFLPMEVVEHHQHCVQDHLRDLHPRIVSEIKRTGRISRKWVPV